jgi:hypothetical protein
MLSHTQWWDGTALAILSEQASLGLGKLSRVGWVSQVGSLLFLGFHALTIVFLVRRGLRPIGFLLIGLIGLSHAFFVGDWMFCGVAWCYAMAFLPYIQAKKNLIQSTRTLD